MKISKEFVNGFIIFIGIGVFFILMELLGLSKYYFLRLFNALIIIYGLDRTLRSNLAEGKKNYLHNLTSAALTGVIGIILGIIGLVLYLNIRGGQDYINMLSENFLFGGNPSIPEYAFGLLIEGIASVLMLVFINMQLWSRKDVFTN